MKWSAGVLAGAMASVDASAAGLPAMSYLRTHGPAGDAATTLGWGLGWISLAVICIIALLLLAAIFRPRGRARAARALTVKTDGGGMGWIYTGVGVTVVILLGCVVWTMFALAATAMPDRTAFTVQVTGSQWWWGVRYLGSDPSDTFTTANEIHIPVGQPVRIELQSADVIHSFWIPQLGGKTDLIPGKTNVMWLQANEPGVYRGQCSEYCGAQHAHMAMFVMADTPEGYREWRALQLRAAGEPASDLMRLGRDTFVARCGACHAVRGTAAGGIVGPDLSHLASRNTIAAGLLPNTPGNLAAWIADSQALKPGSRMPSLALSGPELQAVLGWLQSLD